MDCIFLLRLNSFKLFRFVIEYDLVLITQFVHYKYVQIKKHLIKSLTLVPCT